jgi:uncharacterized protein GlcG (DUF336 family)
VTVHSQNKKVIRKAVVMKHMLIAASLTIMGQSALAQGLPSERYMPLDIAIEAASAALAQCKADGHPVSVEVMNHHARVLVTFHDPFTTIHSAYSAHAKAFTVLSYSRASGETTSAQIAARITKDPASVARIQGIPGLILAPGAVLIKSNGQTVGAIGVGGSTGSTQDEKCAMAGIAKIQSKLDAK